VASINFFSRQRASTASASARMRSSLKHEPPDCDYEHGIERRDDIVDHDAEAAIIAPLDPAHRPGLPDVEQTEKRKTDRITDKVERQDEQGQPLAGDFIDDDPAGIALGAVARRAIRGNPAD